MDQINSGNRNYDTISPSAKWLILMKGHTTIPFARQTAELIEYPEKFVPDFSRKDVTFWARTLHFERRYRSIDQLLADLSIKNILELSSGFSFRGLELTKQRGVHYIDTDLPDVVATKREFTTALRNGHFKTEGKLELLPLNALDEKQFHEITGHFPQGEIVIVNEGLLMYLDWDEKEKLCRIIHKILNERGGYWITADIYFKNRKKKLNLQIDPRTKAFFEQHDIENNKFESTEEAEEFFKRMGFIIDKEAKMKRSDLSSMKYLLKSITIWQLFNLLKARKMHATWRLRVAAD